MSDREAASRAVPLIDLTSLADDDDEHNIGRLCDRASGAGVAAVCVWPRFVPQCRGRLDRSGVRVATVVNFPLGDGDTSGAVVEAQSAIGSGAAPPWKDGPKINVSRMSEMSAPSLNWAIESP